MGTVSVQGVCKQFGGQIVLDQVSIEFHSGEIVGLVGPNGAGKSTLFKIIEGELQPDLGKVTWSKGMDLGYLAQETSFDPSAGLRDVVTTAFDHIFAMEKKLHDLSDRMAAGEDVMAHYDRLQHQFEAAGGYDYEQRLDQVLGGLGFGPQDEDLKVSAMSGGQKSRVALAKLLLRESRFLMLDEPTNHLDIDAVRWLEKFLAGHRGGAVIISHDRYLLDRLVSRVVELENHRLVSYSGNYTNYVQTKELQLLTQGRQFEKDREFIEKEQAFIAKHMAGQRTKEAQGRRTRLERRMADGEFVMDKPTENRKVKFEFDEGLSLDGPVLRADGLAKAYDEKQLFSDLTIRLDSGQRLGITGPNGVGKSTLLKIVQDLVEKDAGEFEFHRKAHIGYYAQDAGGLKEDQLVVDAIREIRPVFSEEQARTLLGAFHFTEERVFKKLGQLSGGEQSRVRLLRLLLTSPNVLIFDEPTNHLDIASREALEQALADYEGTIIAVSHDRYFLDRVADRLLVMRPGVCRTYTGNYSAYIEEVEREQQEQNKQKKKSQAKKNEQRKAERRKESPFDRMTIDEIETVIMEREALVAELNERFADPEVMKDREKTMALSDELAAAKADLAEAEDAWSERAEQA